MYIINQQNASKRRGSTWLKCPSLDINNNTLLIVQESDGTTPVQLFCHDSQASLLKIRYSEQSNKVTKQISNKPFQIQVTCLNYSKKN